MPVIRVVNQTQRLDVALGHVGALVLIIQRQNAAFRQGALNGRQGFARKSWNDVRAVGKHGGRTLQSIKVILTIARQHGTNFQQRGFHLLAERRVREMLDEFAADGQRARFFAGEHHRRKVITLDEAVTDARLGHDGNARFTQRHDIAIHGANADFEMRRQIFRAHDAPALQTDNDRHETVHSVHGRKDNTVSKELVARSIYHAKEGTGS